MSDYTKCTTSTKLASMPSCALPADTNSLRLHAVPVAQLKCCTVQPSQRSTGQPAAALQPASSANLLPTLPAAALVTTAASCWKLKTTAPVLLCASASPPTARTSCSNHHSCQRYTGDGHLPWCNALPTAARGLTAQGICNAVAASTCGCMPNNTTCTSPICR